MTTDDDGPVPFITVELIAAGNDHGGRGVLAGVHIHYTPTGLAGRDVAYALRALADTLAIELDGAFASITAETN